MRNRMMDHGSDAPASAGAGEPPMPLNARKQPCGRTRLTRYLVAFYAAWTVLMAAMVVSACVNEKKKTEEYAHILAQAAYKRDVIYRRWNSQNGPVYAKVSPQLQPNPYLNPKGRDITSPSGLPLTLVNPAFMTRLAHEIEAKEDGVTGHITSLKPISPSNAPDPWETKALGAFERGQEEVSSIEYRNGQAFMRLMRPLFTEESCLKCHAAQGYKVGQVRGGISVSVPMAPFLAAKSKLRELATPYVLIWTIGMVGITLAVRRLRRTIAEVDEMAVRADAANAAKSRFLANMSHEIRTPMTAILGFAETVGCDIECCTTCAEYRACLKRQQNKEGLQVIHRNGKHLMSLINDILDLSKVEAGKMEVERVACSPVRLVEETVSLMRVKAIEKGLSLDARYEFPLPEAILTDPAMVRQTLFNLVGNAVKFTSQGRVEIVVRCLPGGQAGRVTVVFEVKDTGIGIKAEQIGRLFEPFVQADSSTTRQYGGTGLGLAISKRLAQALGGDIQVVSRPGEGSTFSFTIEAPRPASVQMLSDLSQVVAREPHSPQSSPLFAVSLRGRILLAEDGLDNQKLIAAILRTAGAEVDVAANGREAVEKTLAAMSAGTTYDLVLMDMQMPEMDGYQAAGLLRRAGYDKPIVALTAHAMVGDRQKCIDAGCDDYATKPVDRPTLLTALVRFMGTSRLESKESLAEAAPKAPASAEAIQSAFRDDSDMEGIIAEFVAALPDRMNQMSQALANGDWDSLQCLAHQMKGAGGGYGYPQLTEAATALETRAKARDREGAALALGWLIALCGRIEKGASARGVAREENA
jgi:signal transduction histidine kinase/DNA-binding NarL/FixJ family response regulator